MDENETLEKEAKEQSTRPDNWPGMPARADGHEDEQQGSAKVTQAQRDLEKLVQPTRQA
ncbi:MAG: hypothetical protein ACT4TC_14365 [Myxococcaceae bacterium]